MQSDNRDIDDDIKYIRDTPKYGKRWFIAVPNWSSIIDFYNTHLIFACLWFYKPSSIRLP